MAFLNIYEFDEGNATYKVVSQDGIQTSPVQTSHDGTNGEVVEKKLFLQNSNTDFFYTDVTLAATPFRKTRVGDIQFPEAFVGFKIIIQENQPNRGEWLATESGNTARMPDIGTTTQGDNGYKPFWVQIEIPPGTRAQTINDISINVQADENPVGA